MRLKLERESIGNSWDISVLQNTGPYTHPTSLLYLIRIAMEDFVKAADLAVSYILIVIILLNNYF